MRPGQRGRLLAGAAALLRLAALASLAFILAAGLARAKDRCADTAQAVQALHEDDQYQATTLLFAAARLGCEAQARALLDRGAAIDAKDREGKTALAKAAEADKLPVVRLLLERGANVNARAVDGSTPLFYAAEQDRGAVVALLLERGADPNLPGRKGLRALAAAAFNGSTESVVSAAEVWRRPQCARRRWLRRDRLRRRPRLCRGRRAAIASWRRREPPLRPRPHGIDVGGRS